MPKFWFKGLECGNCVLQWKYTSGNNWGKCKDGTSAQGCGPQEEFRGCSDVTIGRKIKLNLHPFPSINIMFLFLQGTIGLNLPCHFRFFDWIDWDKMHFFLNIIVTLFVIILCQFSFRLFYKFIETYFIRLSALLLVHIKFPDFFIQF